MQICFDECYAKHLAEQCEAVKMGMDLTEGVFIGINAVTPRWIISYESFMSFWYDSLGVRHPLTIQANDLSGKISAALWTLLIDYLLRFQLLYQLITWFYLFMLKRLFHRKNAVSERLDVTHPTTVYRLREDFHLRERFEIIDKQDKINDENDDNNNPEAGNKNNEHESLRNSENEQENNGLPNGSGGYYFVDNYFYKSNV